ncbi:uncharacterized protein PAC_15056 [Phialocephala subalpina]|uniref:Uncharacterized protein n=1 Tax=Phialocephala subalpina TaxID=576137 RepID=A0A1L7XJN5_9HELO|nr:uncharacterized protein PAC_15056 [Phialocephala subalpina]
MVWCYQMPRDQYPSTITDLLQHTASGKYIKTNDESVDDKNMRRYGPIPTKGDFTIINLLERMGLQEAPTSTAHVLIQSKGNHLSIPSHSTSKSAGAEGWSRDSDHPMWPDHEKIEDEEEQSEDEENSDDNNSDEKSSDEKGSDARSAGYESPD